MKGYSPPVVLFLKIPHFSKKKIKKWGGAFLAYLGTTNQLTMNLSTEDHEMIMLSVGIICSALPHNTNI